MTNDITARIQAMGAAARAASRELAAADTARKNRALAIAGSLIDGARGELAAANQKDLRAAREAGLEGALLDRLELNPKRVDAMLDGLAQVAALPDPVGSVEGLAYRPSGIQVGRMRVPLGVVAMIYESRPNVTAEAGSLAIKSGNAIILRAGSEALATSLEIARRLSEALGEAGLPREGVQLVDFTDRAAVSALAAMSDCVDLLVPRGGKGLIERVSREARMPVLRHYDGVCHVYVDGLADRAKALAIAVNAKTQRPGVCNAIETLLVDAAAAEQMLPPIAAALAERGVELRGCERSRELCPTMAPATEEDWREEYLALTLAVRVVDGVGRAIEHINQYGSAHSDAIVTEDYGRARRFLREVDSSSVLVNASTRFADGFEYGLGAEIGISTDKFHARGPAGLEALTSQKFVVLGDGEVRV